MAWTSEALARAFAYIDRLAGMGMPGELVSLCMLTNGYDQTDPRSFMEYLYAVDTINHPKSGGDPCLVLWREDSMRNAERSLYLIDDGRAVVPHYVSGWMPLDRMPDGGAIFLNPFPLNVDANGTPRMRADRPEPVNFDGWMLAPRRAYHVKLSRYPAERIAQLRDACRTT